MMGGLPVGLDNHYAARVSRWPREAMKNAKFRLILLASGICLMGLLIGLMTLSSQRQSNELRQRLKRADSETFRIADQFRDYLRRLNHYFFRDRFQFLPAHRLHLPTSFLGFGDELKILERLH